MFSENIIVTICVNEKMQQYAIGGNEIHLDKYIKIIYKK